LEQLVEDSKHHYFGRTVIDEGEFYMHTQSLRKALPDDLEKARRVTRDSSRVVIQAKEQAERTVSEAQAEAQRLLSEARAHVDRTTQDARTQADHVVEDARREAERIVADAQQHAEQLVAEHALTQRAQQGAEEVLSIATQDAEAMRLQADTYAYEVLEKAGIVLSKLSIGIEQGKAQIRQPQAWDDSAA
jgi:vacuolar-type H+-ATPase subunit H